MNTFAIIEDDRLMIEQIRFELEKEGGFTCILAVETAGEFFEKLSDIPVPDILLMDLGLKGRNSIAQLSMIRRLLPKSKVLIITGFADSGLMLQALREGADGYYLKGSEIQLIQAIRAVLSGGAYIEPMLASSIANLLQHPDFQVGLSLHFDEALDDLSPDLSKREAEVLHGLLQGLSYKEVAHSYNISINTVRHHVKSLYKKMGVSGKKELFQKLKQRFPK